MTTDGLAVFFDASGLGAKSYWWDLSTGVAIGNASAKLGYTYLAAGTYQVTLVATDAQGRTSTYVRQVTVG